MTTLNKKIKEKLAFDLTAIAAAKKLEALNVKLKALNEEFWIEYKTQIDSVLQINPKRYDELIQAGALRYTTRVELKKMPNAALTCSENFREMVRKLPITFIAPPESYYRRFTVVFKHNQALPAINEDLLNLAIGTDCKFAKRADELLGEYYEIIKSAIVFKADVASILLPIRTRKVLLERFPEAAKLLPAPAEKTGNLIPTQLINDVRDRLKAGIPS